MTFEQVSQQIGNTSPLVLRARALALQEIGRRENLARTDQDRFLQTLQGLAGFVQQGQDRKAKGKQQVAENTRADRLVKIKENEATQNIALMASKGNLTDEQAKSLAGTMGLNEDLLQAQIDALRENTSGNTQTRHQSGELFPAQKRTAEAGATSAENQAKTDTQQLQEFLASAEGRKALQDYQVTIAGNKAATSTQTRNEFMANTGNRQRGIAQGLTAQDLANQTGQFQLDQAQVDAQREADFRAEFAKVPMGSPEAQQLLMQHDPQLAGNMMLLDRKVAAEALLAQKNGVAMTPPQRKEAVAKILNTEYSDAVSRYQQMKDNLYSLPGGENNKEYVALGKYVANLEKIRTFVSSSQSERYFVTQQGANTAFSDLYEKLLRSGDGATQTQGSDGVQRNGKYPWEQ